MLHPPTDTQSVEAMNNLDLEEFWFPKYARYFVIKSFGADEIYQSIKHEVWCSIDYKIERLDSAFKAQTATSCQGPIFLFFSVKGSGCFCGMAEMMSAVDYNNTGSSDRSSTDKFKGQIKVKWIYVKDVPNKQLKHIHLENNKNMTIIKPGNIEEVPPEQGKMVLKIIHDFKSTTSLLEKSKKKSKSKKNKK